MRTSIFIISLAVASAIQDVPLGECHQCEVTCFEDCSLKYQREIMDDDLSFLQKDKENKTTELVSKYSKCLEDDKCPCKDKDDASPAKGKQLQLMAGDKKKKSKCAVGEVPCSAKCAAKVADADIASMTNQTVNASGRSLLQKRKFPVHSVKIGAFSKGKMTLDHCFKYCLAATCGCADAPGFDDPKVLKKAIKANSVAKGVTDTAPVGQYRPAKVAECGKGIPGKKVATGLYIKLGGGPGGMVEVCTKDFISKVLGPDGDPAAVAKKCKSGASEDAKYGCLWDNKKGYCHVGFSPILRCQTKYFNDK
jgi:hypothetical protein